MKHIFSSRFSFLYRFQNVLKWLSTQTKINRLKGERSSYSILREVTKRYNELVVKKRRKRKEKKAEKRCYKKENYTSKIGEPFTRALINLARPYTYLALTEDWPKYNVGFLHAFLKLNEQRFLLDKKT